MYDGMPYGRIQGQGQGHEPIQGSRIENLQSREVDRQSPMGLIFYFRIWVRFGPWQNLGYGLVHSCYVRILSHL